MMKKLTISLILTCCFTVMANADETSFHKWAKKVFAGEKGVQPTWKLDIIRNTLKSDIKISKARKTNYCRYCAGTNASDGSRVRYGTCAASKNIPLHSIVWVQNVGLLLVTDRGGAVKVRRGNTADFDVWVPKCPGKSRNQHTNCWHGPGTINHLDWLMIKKGDGKHNRNSYKFPVNAFERAIGVKQTRTATPKTEINLFDLDE